MLKGGYVCTHVRTLICWLAPLRELFTSEANERKLSGLLSFFVDGSDREKFITLWVSQSALLHFRLFLPLSTFEGIPKSELIEELLGRLQDGNSRQHGKCTYAINCNCGYVFEMRQLQK